MLEGPTGAKREIVPVAGFQVQTPESYARRPDRREARNRAGGRISGPNAEELCSKA
jgi:hypothetical protein